MKIDFIFLVGFRIYSINVILWSFYGIYFLMVMVILNGYWEFRFKWGYFLEYRYYIKIIIYI